MGRRTLFFLALAAVPVLAAAHPAGPVAGEASQGKPTYEQRCAPCHGTDGRGQGPAAVYLHPKPRDFTTAQFRVRSTPSGSLPTDADLDATLLRGMPGSSMPSFALISAQEREDVIAYLKTFSDLWTLSPPAEPIAPGLEPPVTPERLVEGKALYQKMQCWDCHGETGLGDGPSATTLTDDRGVPILVRDFTDGVYKGGSTDTDLYLRLTTGMDGTPMPQYPAEVITEPERWSLVQYVQSLRRPRPPVNPPSDGRIVARHIQGDLPGEDPLAHAWTSAPAYDIPLAVLWQQPERIGNLQVRALWTGKAIGLLLTWDDSMADQGWSLTEQFRDAVAVQMPLRGRETALTMGTAADTVNIWQWKADWQASLTGPPDIAAVHPAGVVFPLPPMSPPGIPDPFVTAAAVGNPLAVGPRPSPVEEANAAGLGTLASHPRTSQQVRGRGIWQDGKWRVVMTRPLRTADPADVRLGPGADTPIAFAVWNGTQGDRNGQKSVSTWYRLHLEE